MQGQQKTQPFQAMIAFALAALAAPARGPQRCASAAASASAAAPRPKATCWKAAQQRGLRRHARPNDGSAPSALKHGVPESAYGDEGEMFDLVHEMRERIACCLDDGALRQFGRDRWTDIGGGPLRLPMVERIVPLLKCDKGWANLMNQLMKKFA